MANPDPSASAPLSPLDRFLRLFSDVRGGEGVGVLLMFANVFLILLGYYIIKTVREPLILTGGGAAIKTYASAGQALALIAFIPIYSWLAARLKRSSLIVALNLFFVACIILFEVAIRLEVRYVGVVFFIWVGIFNLSIIAQFWSYANDIYTKEMGERLFPVIAIGATARQPDRREDRRPAVQDGPAAALHAAAERRDPAGVARPLLPHEPPGEGAAAHPGRRAGARQGRRVRPRLQESLPVVDRRAAHHDEPGEHRRRVPAEHQGHRGRGRASPTRRPSSAASTATTCSGLRCWRHCCRRSSPRASSRPWACAACCWRCRSWRSAAIRSWRRAPA